MSASTKAPQHWLENPCLYSDLGRLNDKSTMFFQKVPSNFSCVHPLVCVGLSTTDKLQIINLPSELIDPIKQVAHHYWPKSIQNEAHVNVLEIRLSGNPWSSTNLQSIMAKVLIQNIIATLHRYQWVYTVNVNIKSTNDSLYFRYDPNLPEGQSPPFCTISLNRTDRLRVISAPEEIVNMIRGVIQTVWSHGKIQKEKDHHGSWEFKILGNPWASSNRAESIMARYLILKILEAMLQQGWHNVAAIDVHRRATGKLVLIFQQREPKHSSMMCLSLNNADKFQLINMPSHLVEHFKQVLLSRWFKGIQEEEILNLSFGRVKQLKLNGSPWNGGLNNDAYHTRSFLCFIFEEFAKQGWRILMAGDVSAEYGKQEGGPYYPIDVHSFWFINEPTQQPTAPSYGFNISTQPYGVGMPPAPLGTGQPAGYGIPQAMAPYPPTAPDYIMPSSLLSNPNEPPPTYDQAIRWNTCVDEK